MFVAPTLGHCQASARSLTCSWLHPSSACPTSSFGHSRTSTAYDTPVSFATSTGCGVRTQCIPPTPYPGFGAHPSGQASHVELSRIDLLTCRVVSRKRRGCVGTNVVQPTPALRSQLVCQNPYAPESATKLEISQSELRTRSEASVVAHLGTVY